ncbi:MAG: TRAM domain-containing protein, partial [bacterium]
EGEKYTVLIEDQQFNNPEDGVARINGYIIIVKGAGHLLEKELQVKITDLSRTFARAEMA